MYREMGGLGERLATLLAGVRFQTQVNVHVMFQLNSGAKLLVAPEDKPCSLLSNHNLFLKRAVLVLTFGIGIFALQSRALRGEVGAEVDWRPQPAEDNRS